MKIREQDKGDGDMSEDSVKCSNCGSSFNKMFLMGKQGNADVCPVCGADLQKEEEHPDWITWYYYKDEETKCYTLRDEPIDLEKWTDTKLIQEFKAPPRDSAGSSAKAKEILRTYVPNAFSEQQQSNTICCPRCGCTEFTLLNRGYSLLTGFLGSGKVKRVCNQCKKEF